MTAYRQQALACAAFLAEGRRRTSKLHLADLIFMGVVRGGPEYLKNSAALPLAVCSLLCSS